MSHRTHRPHRRIHAHLGLVSLAAGAMTLLPAGIAGAATSATPVSGSSYFLASGATGQCLGGQWDATGAQTPVVGQPCQGLLGQRWQLTSNGTGGWTVADRAATGLCLTVPGGSTAAGTALVEDACGGAGQLFALATAADGSTLVQPQGSALCLDLPAAGSTAPAVRQDACAGTRSQEWLLSRADPLAYANPGFEQGTSGWTFTAHTGIGTNNPHLGADAVYLDAGTGYRVSQTVTAPQAGRYDFSAWIATGAAGGTLSVQVNGRTAGSVQLPSQSVYAKYTVPRIAVKAGDRVTLAIGSAATGWVNADDVSVALSAPNDPQISSDNATLAALFDWAKTKANSFASQPGSTGPINADENNTGGAGQGVYSNTYWAGYPFRSDFYSRDFAHQLVGAHLLGLDADNKTMLKAFASSATQAQNYDPYWSVNFDAKTPGSIDYHSPTDFVRELPAPFELAQKVDDAYQWTGDSDYLNDPTLSSYVSNTVGPFIASHTGPLNNNGHQIAEASSGDIFQGVASYNENGATLAESGDSIGSQYAADLAAAALASAKGDSAAAATYSAAAADLKGYYNNGWSGSPNDWNSVVRAYDTSGNAYTDFGKENSWFMPLKGIMDPGYRETNYLNFIDGQASGPGAPSNLEADTYLPDVFFAHDMSATGWKWMQYVYANIENQHSGGFLNADYPEVSFTLLSQTVQGLMGVQPDAAGHALTTHAELPGQIGYLQLTSIPVGANTVTLRHDGLTKSTLTNTSGGTLGWTAQFTGGHAGITVNGVAQPVRTTTVDGNTYTYATVSVPAGKTAVVQVNG
ncbi:RICIN domain-containing protein [Kitasatospora viridis]|uniref:Ricin-type beta-trefoil lectin protein n=1 Tax=Kitasatospora viridis TaxID=281105 RepID=A0A561UQE2_9ACTN|nr:RICIN domain-containing protein [Kitasatospora viridis]TWG01597.1 ricin-type beta-trefoil lectin protein [Kitasatospora viridis]